MIKRYGLVAALAVALVVSAVALHADQSADRWTQWGGPNRDFKAASSGLAKEWPDEGPPKLWSRELGEGYSAILVEGDRLYTMYRADDKETVVCLSAKNGETIWEHGYESPTREQHVMQFGDGPRATPLISGDRIYTIGVSGKMHCLNKSNGKVVWSHDLWDEFGGNFLMHGYSSSPLEYEDNVIALVGGEDQGVIAFNKKTGKVAWKSESFDNSYSSPRILRINGEDQLVTFMATELIGLDPDTGKLKWQFHHENQFKQNVNMPEVVGGDHLFLSSTEAGARGLKLTKNGEMTDVEEIWSSRKIQFYHVTTVRDGDYVYGSTGSMGPAFMAAVNIKTGEIAWRERGFAKANCLLADGKLLILDEDGNLALATATPEGFTVHSKFELLEKVAWTVPTVVGNTMFVRDKKNILALDLG